MRYFFLLSFLWFHLVGSSQPPLKFHCRYGGNGYDVGYDVKQTLDKGYIITGSTSSFGQGNTDMYLLKLDSMGQVKFQTSFGGYSNDIGKSIVILPDSGFVIVGYTSSTGIGGYDFMMVKADKTGALQWQKTFGGSDWDFAHSIKKTSDGGFIIAGTTYSYGYGNADGYVIKTDGVGTVEWSKYYGGKRDDEFKSVIETNDGNFALTGYTKSYSDSLGDAWVFKIDSNGDSLFSKSVGGNRNDCFNNVVQLNNGNLYYVGYNMSVSSGGNAVNWQYVIDSNQNTVLNNFIGNTNIERYNSSALGLGSKLISVGYNNYLGSSSDANIHVFNQNLSYYGYYPFGLGITDELYSVSPTIDKGFVGIGKTFGNGSQLDDVLFVKMDSLGNYGLSIVGINELKKELNELNVFPNPTPRFLKVNITTINPKVLTYDLRNVNSIIIKTGEISSSDLIIDFSENIESGIYFLEIFDSHIRIGQSKILIIKQD